MGWKIMLSELFSDIEMLYLLLLLILPLFNENNDFVRSLSEVHWK